MKKLYLCNVIKNNNDMENNLSREFAGISTETLDEVLNLVCKASELLNPTELDLNSLSVAHKDCALQLKLISIPVFNEIVKRNKQN